MSRYAQYESLERLGPMIVAGIPANPAQREAGAEHPAPRASVRGGHRPRKNAAAGRRRSAHRQAVGAAVADIQNPRPAGATETGPAKGATAFIGLVGYLPGFGYTIEEAAGSWDVTSGLADTA